MTHHLQTSTRRRGTQGFTLVELIVVITILAILWTIGFISLQGYSLQSRNSKRLSDIRSISSQVSIKSTEGLSLTSMIADSSSKSTASLAIGWMYLSLLSNSEYNAGAPSFTTLWINPIKDGVSDYRIWASTRNGGIFQIAATMENSSGTKTAAVTGNYSPRTNAAFPATWNATWVSGESVSITNLTGAWIAFFKLGDRVLLDCTGPFDGTAIITKVWADGASFIAQTNTTNANGAVLNVSLGDSTTYANFHELPGLVGAVGALGTQTVTDKNTYLPY